MVFPHVPVSDLSSALSVLSAMITPAVLILACGSLSLTTSNRLTRVIDRVRELSREIEMLAMEKDDPDYIKEKRSLLFTLLDRSIHRARMLQIAMTFIYLGLSTFVATSVSIGLVALTLMNLAVFALVLGFIGAGLMLAASLILILESRIALKSTYIETEFLWKRGQHHIPPEARYMRRRWSTLGSSEPEA